MRILITIVLTVGFISSLQVTAQENTKNVTEVSNSNKTNKINENVTDTLMQTSTTIKTEINTKSLDPSTASPPTITSATLTANLRTERINYTTSTSSPSTWSTLPLTAATEATSTSTPTSSETHLTPSLSTDAITTKPTPQDTPILNQYCAPSLCEFYNGTHTNTKPHIACKNRGNFSPACGSQPHLLEMSVRRRNLILDLHNLARSRIASGQVDGYTSASHMPQLKWDNELEYLAGLHVKRCRFEHDLCHNTPRYPYSGQNIGYFWKGANITSHSKRMKNFIVNWYKEHKEANQTFIDSFHLHPDK